MQTNVTGEKPVPVPLCTHKFHQNDGTYTKNIVTQEMNKQILVTAF
jgi:hypothetical protein